MSKVRVYEIAKQLNISTKEILNKLKEYGFAVHSHMSSLQEDEVNLIMDYYKQEDVTKEKEVDGNKIIKPPTPILSKPEMATPVQKVKAETPSPGTSEQTAKVKHMP